jgi:DNA-binding NarL/FixJ family response regulator
MDLQMPGIDGIGAIGRIRDEFPDAHIIVLTTYTGDTQVLRALKAGARATSSRDTCIRTSWKRSVPCMPDRSAYPPTSPLNWPNTPMDDELTEREIDVLKLVAAGNANKQIADQLSIGEATVKSHVSNILSKLGANDRSHAVTIGLKRGIIELDLPQK